MGHSLSSLDGQRGIVPDCPPVSTLQRKYMDAGDNVQVLTAVRNHPQQAVVGSLDLAFVTEIVDSVIHCVHICSSQ